MPKYKLHEILPIFLDFCILQLDEQGNILTTVINTKTEFNPSKVKNIQDIFVKEDRERVKSLLYLGLIQKKRYLKLSPKFKIQEYVDISISTKGTNIYAYLNFFESRRDEELKKETRLSSISEKAETDLLTGLYNRHGYWYRVSNLLKGHDPDRKLGIVMLDMDGLKTLNDTKGHLVGDKAIKQVGQLIKDSIRIRDIATRWGRR